MSAMRNVAKVLLVSFLLSISCSNAKIRLLLTPDTKQGLALSLEKGGLLIVPSVKWCDKSNVWHKKSFSPTQGDCDLPDGVSYFTVLLPLDGGGILNFVFDANNLGLNIQFQQKLAAVSKNMSVDKQDKIKEMYEQWYCGASGVEKKYFVDISTKWVWGPNSEEIYYVTCYLIPTDGRESVASMVRLS